MKSKNTFKETIKPIELKKKVNVNKGSEKSSEWTTHSYAEEVIIRPILSWVANYEIVLIEKPCELSFLNR